ncbi:MAG TPA: DUF3313 family protein [Allosphingosinicella sp.]
MRKLPALIAAIALTVSAAGVAKGPPASWDGLLRVKSKHLENVYLLPNADFRTYTKVILDPSEVAFEKNWQRDYNSSTVGLGGRMSDRDARAILDEAQKRFDRIFAPAFEKAGYQVVTEPGEDVLRVSMALINFQVQAPDQMSAGRSRTFSREAGQATLVLEARDSLSGQVLGRAVDAQWAGDTGPLMRNRVTNIADFERLFSEWAKRASAGIDLLKSHSPIDASGALRRR